MLFFILSIFIFPVKIHLHLFLYNLTTFQKFLKDFHSWFKFRFHLLNFIMFNYIMDVFKFFLISSLIHFWNAVVLLFLFQISLHINTWNFNEQNKSESVCKLLLTNYSPRIVAWVMLIFMQISKFSRYYL